MISRRGQLAIFALVLIVLLAMPRAAPAQYDYCAMSYMGMWNNVRYYYSQNCSVLPMITYNAVSTPDTKTPCSGCPCGAGSIIHDNRASVMLQTYSTDLSVTFDKKTTNRTNSKATSKMAPAPDKTENGYDYHYETTDGPILKVTNAKGGDRYFRVTLGTVKITVHHISTELTPVSTNEFGDPVGTTMANQTFIQPTCAPASVATIVCCKRRRFGRVVRWEVPQCCPGPLLSTLGSSSPRALSTLPTPGTYAFQFGQETDDKMGAINATIHHSSTVSGNEKHHHFLVYTDSQGTQQSCAAHSHNEMEKK